MLTQNDISILRELAAKYMHYASLPIQNQKRELWYSLNRLDMKKPMVLIDQIPWNELMEDSLVCRISHSYWQIVERRLRTDIYKWEHLPVDMVLSPYICLPRPISDHARFGLNTQVEYLGEDTSVFAQKYTDVLENEEALERIQPVKMVWYEDVQKEIEEFAHIVFDGIAEFRFMGMTMHLGLWDWISEARSVTNCYFDLMDRPEFLHSIMRRLTDCMLDTIEQCNQLKLFDAADPLCHCSHTFSDDLPTGINEATSNQAWAFGLAQLFSSAAPEITEEFEVPYMQEIFSHFGAIYYGCCEKLDDRLDILAKMPNIRKISCSPWSNREHFAETLPKKYIMSNKPNPALLAGDSFDEQAVRDDLRRTMAAAKANGLALEMILKDISTIKKDPARLWRWAEIATEETALF